MRARIGLILPMDNAVLEPEFCALGLPRVTAHAVRLSTDQRPEMPQQGIELSSVFTELGVDAVGYACAETSFLGGVDENHRIGGEIARHTGVPAVTAIASMVEALEALGAARIAVAAPYRPASAESLSDYLEATGFSLLRMHHRDFSEEVDDPREWYATNRQPPEVAADMARAADHPDADAVVIAATNLRSLDVLSELERTLRKPVISTNSALIWALLQRAGVSSPRLRDGRLDPESHPTEMRS